jgi:hypothetical protein
MTSEIHRPRAGRGRSGPVSILLIGLSQALGWPALAAEEARTRFDSEYPSAIVELKKAYGRIQCEGEMKYERVGRDRSGRFAAATDGKFSKLDLFTKDRTIDLAGPDGKYRITKYQNNSNYFLDYYLPLESPANMGWLFMVSDVIQMPFRLLGRDIDYFLADEGVSIREVTYGPTGNVRVRFGREAVDKKIIPVIGTFDLEPSRGWALSGYRVEFKNGLVQEGIVEFADPRGGEFPLRRCFTSYVTKESDTKVEFRFDRFDFAGSPARDFSIEKYGFDGGRRTVKPADRDKTPYVLWGTGFGFTAVAILLRRVGNRAHGQSVDRGLSPDSPA